MFIPIIDQISSTTDVNVTSFLFNLESERITREGRNTNTSCVENLQKFCQNIRIQNLATRVVSAKAYPGLYTPPALGNLSETRSTGGLKA